MIYLLYKLKGADIMKKPELVKCWKQLDQSLEAIEKLQEAGFKTDGIDFSAIVSLKNDVEESIHEKTRTAKVDLC